MILFTCVATIMINLSGYPWNQHDIDTKERAVKTCKKDYNDCLKKFIKKEPRVYNAICGGKKEE